MKIKFKAKIGTIDHYFVGGRRYKVGDIIEVADDIARRVLESHPKSFVGIDEKKKA